MFHSLDEARRDRAEAERLDFLIRSWPHDPNAGAAWLGLYLAERLFGADAPWRRRRGRPIAIAAALRQVARPRRLEAAND
ncbi:MAG TPA: hypothetical protein PLV04_11175 [Phenylobacterium sp.]|nr:hypothetical protein [Phenylobacterium sp.]HQP21527.1 hypothetical protein [Phenylobacterium sp.]